MILFHVFVVCMSKIESIVQILNERVIEEDSRVLSFQVREYIS
jgi:hypothetical protein